jgi:hypothetical protein
MKGDGHNQFFKHCNFDKYDMQLINAFLEIKQEMLNEDSDAYTNGKVHTK